MKDAPKSAPSSEVSPLLAFLTSDISIKDLSKDYNRDYQQLQRQAKREGWESIKREYKLALRKRAVEKQIDIDLRQITELKAHERAHIFEAIDQLEKLRQSLHMGNQLETAEDPEEKYPAGGESRPYRPTGRPKKQVDEYQLTIDQIRRYAEARQTLQKMLYKSYGIDQAENSGGKTSFIFNNFPQSGEIVKRYSQVIETPPTGQFDTPTPRPHTTPTDPNDIKSESLSSESLAEIEFTDPIGYPEEPAYDPYAEKDGETCDKFREIVEECVFPTEEEAAELARDMSEGKGAILEPKVKVSFTATEFHKKKYPRFGKQPIHYEPLADFDE